MRKVISPYGCHGTPVDELVAARIGTTSAELTQDKVEAYQIAAFRRTMRYAIERSRFYRELFDGIDPDNVTSLSDLITIPTTSESDLAGNEWKFQCISSSEIKRNVTVPTTGTSGLRKRIAYDAEDQARSIEFINRGFLTQKCSKGERMLVLMSGITEGSIGDLVMRAMAPLEMDIKVYGAVTDIADAYNALMEFRPGVLEAIPWHAAALARYGSKFGNPEREFIRSVNLSADLVPDAIVRRLQELWQCNVHRHYGTTEMVIFGGVECLHHKGYHTRPCDILYEIPEADENGFGELLITTLDRKSMPLIRYRTGDIARFIDTPCPCGCRIRRIEKFLGRKDSLIQFGGCSFYFIELAEALYDIKEVTDFDIQILKKTPAELSLTVRTLPDEHIYKELIERNLSDIPGLNAAINDGTAVLTIGIEDMTHFPSGYNLKKKVIRL